MLRKYLWLTCLCVPALIFAQKKSSVGGTLLDLRTKNVLAQVKVCAGGCAYYETSGPSGGFNLQGLEAGNVDLVFTLPGYRPLKMPVELISGEHLQLGIVYLEPEVIDGMDRDHETDARDDLTGEEGYLAQFSSLNAIQGVYQKRSAFNFSQAFYRIRGYDSKYREVLINGMPFNDLLNGRPSFALWGGLNDMFREREFAPGLDAVQHGYGNLGGSTEFRLRPVLNRKGLRVSTSASNRSYAGRIMASYNSGWLPGNWAYSFSLSRRWAEQGYIPGSLYDAFSLFASIQYNINPGNSMVLNAFYAPSRRGSRAAITREVADLAGNRYNPYWGYYRGEMRNSRTRKLRKPVFLINYFHETSAGEWQMGFLYSPGFSASGRLGYYNAPNPDPVYYRYLPSAQVNGTVINFENARLVRDAFREDPQLNWESLYDINTSGLKDGQASYILYDDVEAVTRASFSFHFNRVLRGKNEISMGLNAGLHTSGNYARIKDLLGADYHLDVDPFSNTTNDLEFSGEKKEGDRFRYHYLHRTRQAKAYVKYTRKLPRGALYLNFSGSWLNNFREGLFRNERYPDNSLGKGEPLQIWGGSVRAGSEYRITGRHVLSATGIFLNRIPDLESLYINPRENHLLVNDPAPEQILGGELKYRMDLPSFRARAAFYYTGFSNLKEVAYYYYDGGVGNAFVQELSSGVEKLHYGSEITLAYDLTSEVKLDLVCAYGIYTYSSDPDISINFNTVNEEELISREGFYDLGEAKLRGLHLSGGPQMAMAIGAEYRAPDYWWLGVVSSYMDRNYTGISRVRRTSSFFTDPGSGEEFADIDADVARELLKQERLQPMYYLDLTGGKSWLISDTYISLFVSINNLFNAVYETGGYEQNRVANYGDLYRDSLSGFPSFGSKYWYGYGRTFFINLAVNF